MGKLFKSLLIVFGVLFFSLYFNSDSAVEARETLTGEEADLNIEFRVFSDISDAKEQTSKGGYISVNTTTKVKVQETWLTEEVIFSKLKAIAEDSLKQTTGKDYSVISLVKDNGRFLYSEDIPGHTDTVVNTAWDANRIRVHFARQWTRPLDDYNLVVNIFASENGPLNGWHLFGGAERYYINNDFNTGLRKVGQTTYLFDKYGAKQYGWHVVQGWSMYFNEENGGLWTGKRKIGQTTYLFNSQGHKIDGWHRLNGKDYFFNRENGGMWTGKRTIGRTTYLLHNDGHKIYGWHVDSNGGKYYFDPNFGGGMVTSLRKVGNAYYYFDTTTGRAVTNRSMNLNGQNWYFNESGVGSIRK